MWPFLWIYIYIYTLMCVHSYSLYEINWYILYTDTYSLHIVENTSPYTCHTKLAYQVKLALNSSRKGSPTVRLEVAMNLLMFRGGLAHYDTKLPVCVRQQPVYGISMYSNSMTCMSAK